MCTIKTIAVDCRLIDSSGVGSYIRGILPYLMESEYNIVLLGNPDHIKSFFPNVSSFIISCNIPSFTVKDIFFFPKKISKIINKCDYYFTPFFNIPSGIKIPAYITIHDIIFHDIKHITSLFGRIARKLCFYLAHKKCKKIFTVSNFSKNRIESHLGKEKPVVVTYESINSKYFYYRNKNTIVKKEENIVFISNLKKHKGLNILIDAFIAAKKEGLPHNLTIIGNMNRLRTTDNAMLKKIKKLNNQSIKLTGFITDEELINILASASLLVNPSFYEGFGLPVLEALVLGTHVLISDIPTFKEIYRDFPVTFFKTNDSIDLKNKLMELVFNKIPSRAELTEELLNKYSFKKTTSIILKELV